MLTADVARNLCRPEVVEDVVYLVGWRVEVRVSIVFAVV
jgi:hypothetical protein